MTGTDRMTTGCLSVVIAGVVGFFLMIPLAMLFNAMNWPLFHGWGLAHGSFILAWPLLTLLSFGLLRGFRWLRKENSR